MAARPEHGRTVFRCECTERPDDIDLIFAAVARRLPEILIAVRDLRERAFVQFDGLGEVEDDPVAPGFEHRLDDPQHLVASDQCGRMLRTAQQGPEALRASAVEAAFTERRRSEAGQNGRAAGRERGWQYV